MSPTALALVATVGCAWALFWNVLAFRRLNKIPSQKKWSRVHAGFGGFSLFYFFAWGLLVVNPSIDRAAWSEAVTPGTIGTFFILFGMPSAMAYFEADPRKAPSPEEIKGAVR